MRKIRVCQVLNAYQVGGAETVALDLARGLDPDQFESLAVSVIEPWYSEEPEMLRRFRAAGVPAHVLHHQQFRDPRTLWDLVRFFHHVRPDIVHSHNRFADLWASRCARWARVPFRIWTRHLVYLDMSPRQLARYRKLAASTPLVIAVSNAVARHCIDTEGWPQDKIRTVVNGIDTDRFRPSSDAERNAKRAELGLGPHEFFLLFVGRLTDQKQPGSFLTLVKVLRERGLPVRGFLCGHGDLEASLVPFCTSGSGLTMLGLRADIPGLLGACDLFVSTSRNEGLPLNIMEAMATGTAFVGPDLDQVVQLVEANSELASGLFQRPPLDKPPDLNQIKGWADLVTARLADPALRLRCGMIGRAVIRKNFSLHRMVHEHEDIYRTLIARA